MVLYVDVTKVRTEGNLEKVLNQLSHLHEN